MNIQHVTLQNPKSRFEIPLIWLLSVALIAAPLIVLQQNSNDVSWGVSIWIFVIIVTWTAFAGQALIREPVWQRNPTAFRVAELVIFALLLRVFLWGVVEGFPTSAEWQGYLLQPWNIFGGLWALYFVLTIVIWLWVNDLVGLFHKLEVTNQELGFYQLPPNERRILRETMLLRTDRSTLSQMFFTRWVIGAVILLCCAAASTLNLPQFASSGWFTNVQRFSLSPAMLLTLLIYLFAGFWLLSYSRYTALYARCLINGIRPHETVAHSWRRVSLMLLATIGLIAAFLPIGSSVPIAMIAQGLIWLIGTIGLFIINLFILIFALFASLFVGETETVEEVIQEAPTLSLPPELLGGGAAEASGPSPLMGGLTWVFFGVVVLAAAIFLWRRVGGMAGIRPMLAQLTQRLRTFWQQFWHGVQDQLTEARIYIAEQLGREAPLRRNDPRRRLNPDELSAREQVRYFYLQTVRRAQQKGVERQTHQTPAEFLSELQAEWPESAEDTEHLTEAFLHARYSPLRVDKQRVNPIKEAWGRLRKSLKKRKKK
ncbi:MAG: DUF4129 domain-containing protein [Candidatus Promineifilaceae bacterium]